MGDPGFPKVFKSNNAPFPRYCCFLANRKWHQCEIPARSAIRNFRRRILKGCPMLMFSFTEKAPTVFLFSTFSTWLGFPYCQRNLSQWLKTRIWRKELLSKQTCQNFYFLTSLKTPTNFPISMEIPIQMRKVRLTLKWLETGKICKCIEHIEGSWYRSFRISVFDNGTQRPLPQRRYNARCARKPHHVGNGAWLTRNFCGTLTENRGHPFRCRHWKQYTAPQFHLAGIQSWRHSRFARTYIVILESGAW